MGCCGSSAPTDVRDCYDIQEKLGAGAFGQVRKCTHFKTGDVRAVKIIWKEEQGVTLDELMEEIHVNRLMDHPNIVKLYDFFEDEKFLYCIMDCFEGGELFEKLRSRETIPETLIVRYVEMMVSAVQYCGTVSVVHRDIKPENFLFRTKEEDSDLVMIDFGLSQRIGPTEWLSVCCGTAQYLSPEQIRGMYRYTGDMWSVGVVVFLLLYGKYPFAGSSDGKVMQQIMNKDITKESCFPKSSKRAQDFLAKILEKDPKKRITPEEALAHIWIEKGPAEASAAVSKETLQNAHQQVAASKRIHDQKQGLEALEQKRDQEFAAVPQRRESLMQGMQGIMKGPLGGSRRDSGGGGSVGLGGRGSVDSSAEKADVSQNLGKLPPNNLLVPSTNKPAVPQRRPSMLHQVKAAVLGKPKEETPLKQVPNGKSKFVNSELQDAALNFRKANSIGDSDIKNQLEEMDRQSRLLQDSSVVKEKSIGGAKLRARTFSLREAPTDASRLANNIGRFDSKAAVHRLGSLDKSLDKDKSFGSSLPPKKDSEVSIEEAEGQDSMGPLRDSGTGSISQKSLKPIDQKVRQSVLDEQEEAIDNFDMDAFEPPPAAPGMLVNTNWVDEETEKQRDDLFEKVQNQQKTTTSKRNMNIIDTVKKGSQRIFQPFTGGNKTEKGRARQPSLIQAQPAGNKGESHRLNSAALEFRSGPVSPPSGTGSQGLGGGKRADRGESHRLNSAASEFRQNFKNEEEKDHPFAVN